MAQSPEYTSLWWPEERIKATLDTKFIVGRLRPENVPRLFDLPRWGEGLTSETYMEWILLKAGRLFLILDAIGIPDRIFALVDESRDDDDLPVAEPNVDLLCLSPHGNDPALDARFFHAQWRFLVRGIAEGDHVVYTGKEGVPVEVVRSTIGNTVQGRDDTVDKVILAGSVCRVFHRTQVRVNGAPHFFSSEEVLAEIKSLRALAHQHLISIYASYFVDDNVCALFTTAEADRTLHNFLTDEPQTFKRLPKEERRQTLITWPHCLASALSWLHVRGHAHAAIRPSNILIDPSFTIYLGQFQALDSLLAPPKVNDLEVYNYSAPERWTRATVAPAVQPTAPSRTHLPSGGRTARRKKPAQLQLTPLNESPPLSPDGPRPDSAASKGTAIRIGLPGSPSRFSFAFSSSSSSSAASSENTTQKQTRNPLPRWSRKPGKLLPTPSLTPSTSTSTSSSSTTSNLSTPSLLTTPPPTSYSYSSSSSSTTTTSNQTAPTPSQILQTQKASDTFSLAATTLTILTHLCKRTQTAFSTHRSARNRSAGRGGGIADASFHLPRNAVQIQSWIALLEGDALKRCRRDRGSDRFFYAVPKMLLVVRGMLGAEPGRRPSMGRVRREFEGAVREIPVWRGEGVKLHCCGGGGKERKEEMGRVEEGAEKGVGESVEDGVEQGDEGLLCSSSVSEFDFGFSDAPSDSETVPEEQEQEPDLAVVEEEPVQVDRVSPQLSLPDLGSPSYGDRRVDRS